MKIVPYKKGFGCKKNDKDNWGIAGATNEVATLKEAVGRESISDAPKYPLDEAGKSSLGGLQGCMRH